MKKKNIFLIVSLCFTIYSLQAQVRVSGSVIDSQTKEPII